MIFIYSSTPVKKYCLRTGNSLSYLSLSFLDILFAKLTKKINNPIATISIAIPIGVPQPKMDSIFYPFQLYFLIITSLL